MTPARVVGAGLSGLAAAWTLADRGFAVTVFEQGPRAGGLIDTHVTPSGLVETAANAFVWDAGVAEWFRRLDLEPVFPLRTSARRYIFRDGEPRRWPLSLGESTRMARSIAARLITRTASARDGESMQAWGHRVVGEAATRWMLEPAMQGIYASAPSQLSARAIFSGRRRGSRRLAAPPGGMGQFTSRLRDRLIDRGVVFRLNTRVHSLEDQRPTVICTPPASAAALIAPHAPELANAIADVRTTTLVSVTMFFAPQPGDVHGFGVLFPSSCGVNALGVLFNTDIFSGRGPVRSETWIIGDRGRELTACDDVQLTRLLLDDRWRLTHRDDAPIAVHITRQPDAIPVYDERILAVKRAQTSLPPWLAVAGNYLGRIGVAALLETAAAAANRIR